MKGDYSEPLKLNQEGFTIRPPLRDFEKDMQQKKICPHFGRVASLFLWGSGRVLKKKTTPNQWIQYNISCNKYLSISIDMEDITSSMKNTSIFNSTLPPCISNHFPWSVVGVRVESRCKYSQPKNKRDREYLDARYYMVGTLA